MLLTASVIIFMMGLVSEQITQVMYRGMPVADGAMTG